MNDVNEDVDLQANSRSVVLTTNSPPTYLDMQFSLDLESTFANSECFGEPVHDSDHDLADDSERSEDMEEPLSDEDEVDGHTSDTDELDRACNDATTILDSSAPWNNLTKFLSEWASTSRCCQASMTNLMAGLRELHCTAGHFLPQHFKTVIKAQAKFFDTVLLGDAVNGVRKVLELCGRCWMHEFDNDDLSGAKMCVHCRVSTIVCGYHSVEMSLV